LISMGFDTRAIHQAIDAGCIDVQQCADFIIRNREAESLRNLLVLPQPSIPPPSPALNLARSSPAVQTKYKSHKSDNFNLVKSKEIQKGKLLKAQEAETKKRVLEQIKEDRAAKSRTRQPHLQPVPASPIEANTTTIKIKLPNEESFQQKLRMSEPVSVLFELVDLPSDSFSLLQPFPRRVFTHEKDSASTIEECGLRNASLNVLLIKKISPVLAPSHSHLTSMDIDSEEEEERDSESESSDENTNLDTSGGQALGSVSPDNIIPPFSRLAGAASDLESDLRSQMRQRINTAVSDRIQATSDSLTTKSPAVVTVRNRAIIPTLFSLALDKTSAIFSTLQKHSKELQPPRPLPSALTQRIIAHLLKSNTLDRACITKLGIICPMLLVLDLSDGGSRVTDGVTDECALFWGHGLRSISLKNAQVLSENGLLNFASAVKLKVEDLVLSGCRVGDIVVKSLLDGQSVLKTLDLSRTHVTNVGVSIVGRVCGKTLEKLSFSRCEGAGGVDLLYLLKDCEVLRVLDVSGTGLIGPLLSIPASSLSKLRDLDVSRTRIGNDDLDNTRIPRGLERLNLKDCVKLSVDGLSLVPRMFGSLSEVIIPNRIDHSIDLICENSFTGLALTRLDFEGCNSLTDVGVLGLGNVSGALQYLSLVGCKVSDECLVKIASFGRLEEVYFDRCVGITDIGALKDLQSLKILSLAESSVNDSSINLLPTYSFAKMLKKLNLSHTDIGNECIQGLGKLLGLRQCVLDYTKIDPEYAWGVMSKIPNLIRPRFYGMVVADADL